MSRRRFRSTAALISTFMLLAGLAIPGQSQRPTRNIATNDPARDAQSEMRPILEYYVVDRGSLQRSFPVASSSARRDRFRKFYSDALDRIQKLDFDAMSQAGKVDYILFRNHLERELRQLDIEVKQVAEIHPLIPFAGAIVDLEEMRRRMEPIDSAKTATALANLKKQLDETRQAVEAGLRSSDRGGDAAAPTIAPIKVKKTVAFRAVGAVNNLRNNLRNWYTFYNGYDPVFTWWNEEPYKALDQSLAAYAAFLSERIVGLRSEGSAIPGAPSRGPGGGQGQGQRTTATPRAGDTSDIVGDPIGREALLSELQSEMIPYTPEELIAFAEKEMAWCENEMKKASR